MILCWNISPHICITDILYFRKENIKNITKSMIVKWYWLIENDKKHLSDCFNGDCDWLTDNLKTGLWAKRYKVSLTIKREWALSQIILIYDVLNIQEHTPNCQLEVKSLAEVNYSHNSDPFRATQYHSLTQVWIGLLNQLTSSSPSSSPSSSSSSSLAHSGLNGTLE